MVISTFISVSTQKVKECAKPVCIEDNAISGSYHHSAELCSPHLLKELFGFLEIKLLKRLSTAKGNVLMISISNVKVNNGLELLVNYT